MPIVEFDLNANRSSSPNDQPSIPVPPLRIEIDRKDLSVTDPVLCSTEDVIVRARVSFDQAIESIRPLLEKAAQISQGLTKPPKEFELEFGIKLTADAGAIFTKVGGEANFVIRATW